MNTHYLGNGTSLRLDPSACNGCGRCATVCPHAVLEMRTKKAFIADRGSCMECGACSRNCPTQAIRVEAGVGCAAAILQGMVRGTAPSCDCGDGANQGGCC